jgi:hypothetical protein
MHLNGSTPFSNGDVHGDGVVVNGNSNGHLDDVHTSVLNGNGPLNGDTNGVDGSVNGHVNGDTNGITNGTTNGTTNGIANGIANGIKNGHTTATNSEQSPIGNIADVPIAIVGMSCRFPGEATSPERLWELCVNARSAWSEVPGDRWNKEAFFHPDGAKTGTVSIQLPCAFPDRY